MLNTHESIEGDGVSLGALPTHAAGWRAIGGHGVTLSVPHLTIVSPLINRTYLTDHGR